MAVQHFTQRARSMKITTIIAVALAHRLPEGKPVTMGFGSTLNRDAIIVRVETSEDITGYCEAHPGRSPRAITSAIYDTLAPLLFGMNAFASPPLPRPGVSRLMLTALPLG